MRMCMETIDYNVMDNGERIAPITLGSGLRQADPLCTLSFHSLY